MSYLGIDPGSKRTGWAFFDDEGIIKAMGVVKGQDKFLDWLEAKIEEEAGNLKVAIVEQYRNRGGSINFMSTMPTSQHIGAISRVLRKTGVKIVYQDPSPCLSIGLRFIGMASAYPNHKHVDDEISAWAHGTYYLKQQGVL